ncbi:hypothetical protein ARMSODRAFT_982801 [Armillaria solidipes]|uniref:Uncharacterized protein n=1 Tax=Armillaria solidipes TaxID=1076256 RepID=A0A2H3APY3_9AGAR|nr:hypothetical protein ARMSODRAFT_982801 [Armillaria solidipes]
MYRLPPITHRIRFVDCSCQQPLAYWYQLSGTHNFSLYKDGNADALGSITLLLNERRLMLLLSRPITIEIGTLYADRRRKARTKPKRVRRATNDGPNVKGARSAPADDAPGDKDTTAIAIRHKLDALLLEQPPNVFAAGVYAKAIAHGNPAEVISTVLDSFTMLDHKSSLKATRAYEKEGCSHWWKLLNVEVERLKGVVILLEDLLCSAMCGRDELMSACLNAYEKASYLTTNPQFWTCPQLPWFEERYEQYRDQTEEPCAVWTRDTALEFGVAYPNFNPTEYGEQSLRRLLQFVCAAFESLDEQARLRAEMRAPYVSKRAARICSPPQTEVEDQDRSPGEDRDAGAQGGPVIDRPAPANPGTWGEPRVTWDDGEAHRWDGDGDGEHVWGNISSWVPGEWGGGTWGTQSSADGEQDTVEAVLCEDGTADAFESLSCDFIEVGPWAHIATILSLPPRCFSAGQALADAPGENNRTGRTWGPCDRTMRFSKGTEEITGRRKIHSLWVFLLGPNVGHGSANCVSAYVTPTNDLFLTQGNQIPPNLFSNGQDNDHITIASYKFADVLRQLKGPPALYSSEQLAYIQQKAVDYKKVKRAGGVEELEFLQAFFEEWFSLFREDPSLTGLDLKATQWARKKDLSRMLLWTTWTLKPEPVSGAAERRREARRQRMDAEAAKRQAAMATSSTLRRGPPGRAPPTSLGTSSKEYWAKFDDPDYDGERYVVETPEGWKIDFLTDFETEEPLA